MRLAVLGVAALLLAVACAGDDPDLAPSGLSRPRLTIEFPATVQSASVHTAVLEVTNPGPGDMDAIRVTFARVGVAGRRDLPVPIVEAGFRGRNEAILDIEPPARSVSEDGVSYIFEGLGEGESVTIDFVLEVPRDPGYAANAVIVEDAQDIERSRGVRLETTVER